MVRFKKWTVRPVSAQDCGIWEWKVGLLIEYESWEKVGTILCEGKTLRVAGRDIEKVGRRWIDETCVGS